MRLLIISLSLLAGSVLADKKRIYDVGQAWTYDSRPGESESKLYIIKVDVAPDKSLIYHVSVDKLRIKNPDVKGGIQDHIPHMPVSKETLDKSVKKLVKENATNIYDLPEGYLVWKKGYDKGKAGVFTISVKEIAKYIEEIIEKQNPRPVEAE